MDAASTCESMMVNDGKSSHNLLQSNFSKKNRKQTKMPSIQSRLPNQSVKKGVPDLRALAHKDVNTVNCIETLAEDGQKKMNLTKSAQTKSRKTKSTKLASSTAGTKQQSNAESKLKQKSQGKKKKEELSGAEPSSDNWTAKGSRTVSSPNGQSLQIAEVSIFSPF